MRQRAELRLTSDLDVADAARAARELAGDCGLTATQAQQLVTAVSEIGTNAVKYGRAGRVTLATTVDADRTGVEVIVTDEGPGILDPNAAMREGSSTGGSLGLGLPAARRLVDDFALETSPAGTVVRMVRWAGRPRGPGEPPVVWATHAGGGGVPVAAPVRNGVLLGVVAGARAADAARAWRTAPWRGPARLAEASRAALSGGERSGVALAAHSALDGRLEWLAAGAATAALVRHGEVLPARRAPVLAPGGGRAAGAVVDLRRDDVLVLVAAVMEPAALAALADAAEARSGAAGEGDGPAWVVARFLRGALEPGRPSADREPDRRGR